MPDDDSDTAAKEANPVGRPSAFKPEFCGQAEDLCKLGAIDKDLAEFFEVDERTINRWKEAHPEFRQSIRAGKIIADIQVAGRLHQRAMGFEFEENHPVKLKRVCYDASGKKILEEEYVQIVPVKRVVPPDTVAVKFWLVNRSDKWRDKVDAELTGKDGGPVQIDGPIDKIDLARRLLHLIAEGTRARPQETPDPTPDPKE